MAEPGGGGAEPPPWADAAKNAVAIVQRSRVVDRNPVEAFQGRSPANGAPGR